MSYGRLVRALIPGTIAGVACWLVDRYYRKTYEAWALEEIEKIEEDCRAKCAKKDALIDFAVREIYEMRTILQKYISATGYCIVIDAVRENMQDEEACFPDGRQSLEECVAICEHRLKTASKSNENAYKIVSTLGYISTKDDGRIAVREPPRAPDSDGTGFVDDWPPMTPNGDIDDMDEDEIEDEVTISYDPSEDYSDEAPEWSLETKIAVSGDDIIRDKPYIISEWQWVYGKKDYAKISLDYLALDDTVLDEDNTELDQKFIGPENLTAFETDDCDSIFIRNDQLEIDYEIMWCESSYIHDILGRPEEEVYGRRIWRSWERQS